MHDPEGLPSISRRTVMGLGFATTVRACRRLDKKRTGESTVGGHLSPEFKAAFSFAVKKDFLAGPGHWAVIYPGDAFTGEPVLIGNPKLYPKPQAGTMPAGWGSATGSIVVGPSVVLRLIYKVNGQDAYITLLPYESMAQVAHHRNRRRPIFMETVPGSRFAATILKTPRLVGSSVCHQPVSCRRLYCAKPAFQHFMRPANRIPSATRRGECFL